MHFAYDSEVDILNVQLVQLPRGEYIKADAPAGSLTHVGLDNRGYPIEVEIQRASEMFPAHELNRYLIQRPKVFRIVGQKKDIVAPTLAKAVKEATDVGIGRPFDFGGRYLNIYAVYDYDGKQNLQPLSPEAFSHQGDWLDREGLEREEVSIYRTAEGVFHERGRSYKHE